MVLNILKKRFMTVILIILKKQVSIERYAYTAFQAEPMDAQKET